MTLTVLKTWTYPNFQQHNDNHFNEQGVEDEEEDAEADYETAKKSSNWNSTLHQCQLAKVSMTSVTHILQPVS